MVVYDVSSIVSKNRNVSDGKLLPNCIDNGFRAAGAGDEFADVEVDEHIKPRNKAFLIYETSL